MLVLFGVGGRRASEAAAARGVVDEWLMYACRCHADVALRRPPMPVTVTPQRIMCVRWRPATAAG